MSRYAWETVSTCRASTSSRPTAALTACSCEPLQRPAQKDWSAGAKGLVIQALGWGNVSVPTFQAVKEVIAKGIPVVISTRVWNGRVLPNYGYEGGGKTLQQAGAVFADNLSPQKARILLMLALQTTSDPKQIQQLFDR